MVDGYALDVLDDCELEEGVNHGIVDAVSEDAVCDACGKGFPDKGCTVDDRVVGS